MASYVRNNTGRDDRGLNGSNLYADPELQFLREDLAGRVIDDIDDISDLKNKNFDAEKDTNRAYLSIALKVIGVGLAVMATIGFFATGVGLGFAIMSLVGAAVTFGIFCYFHKQEIDKKNDPENILQVKGAFRKAKLYVMGKNIGEQQRADEQNGQQQNNGRGQRVQLQQRSGNGYLGRN